MDYRKLIRSRELRLKILQLLSFVPDRPMLKLQYRIQMGRKLNLDDPKRFTEKLQWYKLNYRDPEMIRCADKCEVREYLREKGYGHLLTQDYGTFDSADQVDFESLPQSFVLKDTLGGGGNAVIICKDKRDLDIEVTRRQMDQWCRIPIKRDAGREWPYYSGKKHRIFIEEYLDCPDGLRDYKFFCFDGKIQFMYVVTDRKMGQSGKFYILNRDYERLNVVRLGDEPDEGVPEKPAVFEEMRRIAEELASPFPHVRVDLYEHQGKVMFGELTFFSGSGYARYSPDSFDIDVGEVFRLPQEA